MRKLNRKENMKKLILAVVVLSLGYFAMAKAEDTVTPKEFIGAVASVPGKLVTHLKNEWVDIKAHQKESWADMKQKWPFKKNSSN